MTSSLRNSLHRRNHKERSQLAHRAKLGFLEKHKDYVQRARDYHSKQDRLTRLKQKAAERNKNEFYFSMVKEKTREGVHVKDRGNVALPTDIIKVLKTQDENYVRTMRASNQKKIDKIKNQLTAVANLVVPSEGPEDLDEEEMRTLYDSGILSRHKGKQRVKRAHHIVFVEDDAAAKSYREPGTPKSTPPKQDTGGHDKVTDLGWIPESSKRKGKYKSTTEELDEYEDGIEQAEYNADTVQYRHRLIKELAARLVRDRQLGYAQREFELQRLMMGKGARKKIRGPEKEGGNDSDQDDLDALDARGGRNKKRTKVVDEKTYKPRVYKWRLERKR
ncbi:u3 small nucleolar rna-associated protein 11 [Moniliophthora roreri MCA 2997]|uniref:U3 small nucleolar rna-associated protein 11 n=2 Tax=Moniliophthora roreri TaxID=221103 RepID=V2XFV0_MONRO|nr:u3 small nucleolar rna-associated protein 11 [Moniliophthora roreri MCA 2997]KAI3622661.1 u3 small nucleolar rna-associated protein 11 [Moniliophthora roreri]